MAEHMQSMSDHFYEDADNAATSSLPLFLRELFQQRKGDDSAFRYNGKLVSWREVRHRIASASPSERVSVLIFRSPPAPAFTCEAYETLFKEHLLAEEVQRVVGVYSSADQCIPFTDYCAARLNGMGIDEMKLLFARNSVTWAIKHHEESDDHFYKKEDESAAGETPDEAKEAQWPKDDDGYLESVKNRDIQKVRNVLGNSMFTAVSSRQNKGSAQNMLRLHNLNYIRSVEAHDAETADARRMQAGIPFPVIVKPIIGAGAEFIFLCESKEELTQAFRTAAAECTTQGTKAAHMAVEEYIDGPEYVVNTVGYNNVHVVTDVWRSVKYTERVYSSRLPQGVERSRKEKGERVSYLHSTTLLHDYQSFVQGLAKLPVNSEEQRVVDYTLRCVSALGAHKACSHCEVRVDNRRDSPRRGEPVLIELNPRMQGSTPRAAHLVGYSQFSLLYYLCAVSALYPEAVEARTWRERRRYGLPWPPAPLLYRPLRSTAVDHVLKVVFLVCPCDGVLCGQGARKMMQLPTYQYCTRGNLFEPRDPGYIASVSKTMDLLSSPVAIVLEGPAGQVEQDTKSIRDCENNKQCIETLWTLITEIEVRNRMSRGLGEEGQSDPALDSLPTTQELKEAIRSVIDTDPPLYFEQELFQQLIRQGLGVFITLKAQ
ncbi:hypothetical protein AGDE_10365 [Angomonas deanei]|nr:hypothetical protein AGDE_10365 [Angomonas deanei]|eukprot:EPY28625.1 hypothetical protein AGDE_10365 [Angomonas deanei]